MGTLLEQDKHRYAVKKVPRFQWLFCCCQECRLKSTQLVYRLLFHWCHQRNFIGLSHQTVIGGGLYIGYPYCITINPQVVIGRNVNTHREVVIGQENRGKRKGTPTLGDDIWTGIDASIVGGVKVGSDIMIAPGAFTNHDVPSYPVVIGNPCITKHKDHATEGYINHKSQRRGIAKKQGMKWELTMALDAIFIASVRKYDLRRR